MKDATNNKKIAMTLKPMTDSLQKVSRDIVKIGMTFKEVESARKVLSGKRNKGDDKMTEEQQKEMLRVAKDMSLKVVLKASLENEIELKSISDDVEMLKGTMRINEDQIQEIKRSVRKVVTDSLGGKESIAHKEIRLKAFSEFRREFKGRFLIPGYKDLHQNRFNDAMRYIHMWRPKTNLALEIQKLNGRQTMEWSDEDEQ